MGGPDELVARGVAATRAHLGSVGVERLGLTETLRARTRQFPEGLEALERVAAGDIALAAAAPGAREVLARGGLQPAD